MENEKIVRRMIEYMCAHFPMCRGCHMAEAARRVQLGCKEFRLRRPAEAEEVVRLWKAANTPVRYEQ